MKKQLTFLLLLIISNLVYGQSDVVRIQRDAVGDKLLVNGKPFFIKGMNWDYTPIGKNYNFNFWNQSDEFIRKALDDEMGLLQNMGVNSIRVYTGIPKKWIEYIYNNYGIYTLLNHSFGRYGLNIDGTWVANTDYADEKTRTLLLSEVEKLVNDYKDTKGLLMFLLGNENNYGLFWEGAETESIPVAERKSTAKAYPMYKLFNEAALKMKTLDNTHPVAMCNGDLLFVDIITKLCPYIDVLGVNAYRGVSFTDLFQRVKKEYDKPVMFTEFGSDAFNVKSNQEDQEMQSYYLKGNWKEMYEHAYGMGKTENCIGGYTFQFSDGWWKYGQTKNLDIHDNNASWPNGGYFHDYIKGDNNMNEEWFGICGKGESNEQGHYQLYPRASYYMLKEVNKFHPYATGSSLNTLQEHFNTVNLTDASLKARGDKAALTSNVSSKIRLSRLSAQFTTFNTGGTLITTPTVAPTNNTTYPDKLGFDHMQSYFVGVEANPSSNFRANVEFNILGNVAQNPIDQIFYENRGRPLTISTPNGTVVQNDNNRVQVYNASYNWNHEWFNLNGFYRTGHYHWMYEGDFFGLYPEANYGQNIDIYNGMAPFGMEVEGKKALSGLKVAFGPELWWAANPAVLIKYRKNFKGFDITGMFHEDIDQRGLTESSFAIPQPKTRRATLHLGRKMKHFGVDFGMIWAGMPLNGREIQVQRGTDENPTVYSSTINSKDNWGGKAKITYSNGAFNWYASTAAQGLVANGGADATQTFTGWKLKDAGSGNQYNFLTGFTYQTGHFQIAPNFLWQKPIEGPITSLSSPARPRNILQDPFIVRANRQQVAGELLLTYDPTPATWYYQWDNDRTEDAKFAFNAGFVYRHLPTRQDAAIGILGDGRSVFAFSGSAPAHDLWEANSRIVSKLHPNLGLIANLYAGTAQANGSDGRLLERYGADLRVVYKRVKLMYAFKINDWGPYDYHRDFNLTYPMQQMLDISTEISKPDWFLLPSTKIGIRGTYRTLNKYSPRYNPTQTLNAAGVWVPDPNAIGYPDGSEWEIRTYLHINIGK